MIVGSMNNPYEDVVKEIEKIGEMELDFLELTVEMPHAYVDTLTKKSKRIKDEISRYDLKIVGHMPWSFEIANPYQNIRKSILIESSRILHTMSKFGIRKVTIHPDFLSPYKAHLQDEKLRATIDSLKFVNELADDYGMTLCLENGFEPSAVNDMQKIFGSIPGLMFTLDIGHANVGSEKGERILEFMRRFGGRLRHVHTHDNKGKSDDHLPIGCGSVDWPKVVRALKRMGYDDTITLEVHSPDRDYLKMSRDKLASLWAVGAPKRFTQPTFIIPPRK